MSSLLTVAWYTTPSVRHFTSNGQDIFRRHLQVTQTVGFVLVFFVSMALLCDEMTLATSACSCSSILINVLRLQIFRRESFGGKHLSMMARNLRPMLVETFALKGWLNHTTFPLLCRLDFRDWSARKYQIYFEY